MSRLPQPEKLSLVLMVLVLLSGLGLRFLYASGTTLHFDEPFWMLRGDFAVQSLLDGEFSQLQDRHWNVLRPTQGRRLLETNIATGSPTALLTGLGLKTGELWAAPGGIQRAMDQILSARLFHALCSAVTPAILLMLAWRLGLSAFGGATMALFLLLDPTIRGVGSHAHLEAVLTLTMPLSLLLYLLARERESMPLTALSGILFGVAFATRVNAAAVPVALVCFVIVRSLVAGRGFRLARSTLWAEIPRLILFGVCGWLVFVLLFPPIWRSPVVGFLDTLYQYSRNARPSPGESAMSNWISGQTTLSWIFVVLGGVGLGLASVRSSRLFQLAGLYYCVACAVVLLPTPFYARYLSSALPGLAVMGACTATFLWEKTRPWHRVGWPLAALVFCATIASSITDSWTHASLNRARLIEFYGDLHERRFGEILVPSLLSVVHRDGAEETDPQLFLATGTNHVQLTYLGVMWADQRAWARLQEGWSRSRYRGGRQCPEGALQLSTRDRPDRDVLLKMGRLRLWQCERRGPAPGKSG